MLYQSVFYILIGTSLVSSIHAELYAYEEMDCSGPAVVHSETTGCVDLKRIMSSQSKGDDSKHGWRIYHTTDCSGSEYYIAPSQKEDDKNCIQDNYNYHFTAQSAQPNRPDQP